MVQILLSMAKTSDAYNAYLDKTGNSLIPDSEMSCLFSFPHQYNDTIYEINNGMICEHIVSCIDPVHIPDFRKIDTSITITWINTDNTKYSCPLSDFGDTVFFTKEEAELAIQERI